VLAPAPGVPALGRIASITDRNRTHFDDSLPALNRNLVYAVRTVLADSTSYSEGVPDSLAMDVADFPSLYDVAADSNAPVLYVVGDSTAVTRYDWRSGTRTRTQLGGRPGYMALGDAGAGRELFVPNDQGDLAALNPATLAENKRYPLGEPIYGVAPVEGKRLLVSLHGFQGLSLIARDSGTVKTFNYSSSLRLIPSARGIFALGATQFQSPGYIDLFDFGPAPFQPAGTMQTYRTEPMSSFIDGFKAMALSPDDSLVIFSSAGAVYRRVSSPSPKLVFAGTLPVDRGGYTDFAFTRGSDSVYCAVGGGKLVRLITLRDMRVHKEYRMRGFPERLFLRGGEILCLSRIAPLAAVHALEIIDRSSP
jgi:hypothetical protein